MSVVILTGLVTGFGASFYCLATCIPVLVPYTVATDRPSILRGLTSALFFSGGRLIAYIGLLLFFVVMKELALVDSGVVIGIATMASGIILIFSGLVAFGIFKFESFFGKIFCRYIFLSS